MRETYKAVREVLTELRGQLDTQVFRTVELDRGQMDRLLGDDNQEGVIFFPAVFIRFSNIRYEPYLEGVRRGWADMICTIVLEDTLGIDDETIFDYRGYLDNALMDARYKREHLALLDISREDMPLSCNNILQWEVTYDIAFLDGRSYRYRDFVDGNDPETNPNAPVKHNFDGGYE